MVTPACTWASPACGQSLTVTFQSLPHWAPLSPQKGLSVCWKSPAPGGGGRVRLAEGRVSREWLRFGFSWHKSLFSVYQGINHGFQIGPSGRRQDWWKKKKKTQRCWVWGFSMPWSVMVSKKGKDVIPPLDSLPLEYYAREFKFRASCWPAKLLLLLWAMLYNLFITKILGSRACLEWWLCLLAVWPCLR